MLPIHKELVERMFTSGLLKLLFTTETFALGINMPARTVVFNGLKKYDGVSVDYLRTRDYLQMAGRAGRQGIDDEGLVFSLLSDQDLLEAPLERLLSGVPEPVTSRFKTSYSTLLHLVAELGRERVFEAWEKSLDAFQHEDRRQKEQDKNRRKRRRLVQAQFEVLTDLGYLDAADKPTARGRTARLISGFEVQITELLYGGALEDLPPPALAMVFVAQIYEERRRGDNRFFPRSVYGPERYRVDRTLARLRTIELDRGVAEPAKPCDWGLTPAVLAWCEGASLDDLEDLVEVGPGDVCRTFRMAIQLLRQTRAAIDPAWDLRDGLGAAMALLNRDEIDARRQLTLG
jgi:superfamily II RNA helicase